MNLYRCMRCDHEVYAEEKPLPIQWTDGHTCYFTIVEDNGLKVLGYNGGFRYVLTKDNDVYRNDYSDDKDVGLRFFCTKAALSSAMIIFGPLYDEDGNVVTLRDIGLEV